MSHTHKLKPIKNIKTVLSNLIFDRYHFNNETFHKRTIEQTNSTEPLVSYFA